jgi:hypothetical protein
LLEENNDAKSHCNVDIDILIWVIIEHSLKKVQEHDNYEHEDESVLVLSFILGLFHAHPLEKGLVTIDICIFDHAENLT